MRSNVSFNYIYTILFFNWWWIHEFLNLLFSVLFYAKYLKLKIYSNKFNMDLYLSIVVWSNLLVPGPNSNMAGGLPHNIKLLWDISRMSENSTQFWHYLPRQSIGFQWLGVQFYKRIFTLQLQTSVGSPGYHLFFWLTVYRLEVPKTPLLQLQTPGTHPGCYLYFWPTDYRSDVPPTSSLGSVNFLEQLTKLRETFYLLDYWVIIK